jgi:hypothetical protein
VAYDAEKTRQKMLEVGLPERQASRLLAGW